MKAAAAAIFVAGVAFSGFVAAGGGQYGAPEIVVLTFIVGLAALGLRMLTRTRHVGPATCPACGGVVSPNAPYCKHCKTQLG